ncbi:MAG: helix-turn-helix domain-containing protein [Blautia sp.]|nr:helix-turn-helix domain-containing protein [Blautia sp.]
MKLQQLLKTCLLRWKEISGFDFCLLDSRDQIFVTTEDTDIPEGTALQDFRQSGKLSESLENKSIYRINGEDETFFLLLVWGKEESAGITGELAVCQVESLINVNSRKNDRGLIIQDILLGRFSSAEITKQARRIHLAPAARRVVFLIRTPEADDSVLEAVRNVFVNRGRDYVSALDEAVSVVVHELKDNEDMEDIDSISGLLIDVLNTEVMTKAWVSYGNICEDITKLHYGYTEAMTAMEIGRIFYADRHVFGYSRLGIGRLIYQLPVETCEMFIEEIFGEERLDTLDEESMNIVRTFFENNLNLSETSRKLYVHRNTLVYRLEKIQKKYGLDIRMFEDALTFKLAMLVTDYINSKR